MDSDSLAAIVADMREHASALHPGWVLALEWSERLAAMADARDAARIDWLASQFNTNTVRMSGQHPWAPGYRLRDLQGATFREAIDNAIAK